MPNTSILETDFAELSDGRIIELIEDPSDKTKTRFIVYAAASKSIEYCDSVDDGQRTLVPLSRAHSHLRHVCLASGAAPFGTTSNLEAAVGSFLKSTYDVAPKWRIATAAFVLGTWLPERLGVAPYLSLVGPPSSGKTCVMRVLNLLCYRSLFVSSTSASALYETSDRLRPTILLDETLTAGHPREIIHILKTSSTPGAVSLRKDKARLTFGPKVFAWLELPNDAALNSRCLIIPMQKTSRTDLWDVRNPTILEWARQLRMQLMQFRLEHLRDIAIPKIPDGIPLSGRPVSRSCVTILR